MLKKSSLTEQQKKMMIKKANSSLQDNIYRMLKHHPFYASLLSRFAVKTEINEIPVAAVSIQKGRPVRHTNPLGYLTYSQREQIFIDIHEILHITDLHHFRSKGKDPGLWNIATDIEINQQLKSAIAVLPKDALMYYHFNLPEGLSAEEYYEILENRDEPITLPDELKNSLLDDLINGGGGSGNGNESGDQKGGSKKAPGFEKLHPQWEEMANNSPEIQKGVIKSMVRDAMVRSAGNIPGEMKAIIDRLFEAQLNWPRLLSTFAQSLISTKRRYTWARPSRKYGSVKMGTLRKKSLNLMVAIDTSGSVRDEELAQFLAEIDAMKNYAQITIVQCDYNLQSVEEFEKIDIKNFKIKGRGGTSFFPVFELAEKRKVAGVGETEFSISESPDAIIYLTDGEATAPAHMKIPTLWVLSPEGRKPQSEDGGEIDWGRFAQLDK